jgi:hypothetical protein
VRRCRALGCTRWLQVQKREGLTTTRSAGQARGVKGKDEDWRACEERADVLANKFCSRNEGSGAADKKCLLHGAAGSIVDRPTPAGMECALLSLEISEQ